MVNRVHKYRDRDIKRVIKAARAAGAKDKRAFARASGPIRKAQADLARAVAALEAAGYKVAR